MIKKISYISSLSISLYVIFSLVLNFILWFNPFNITFWLTKFIVTIDFVRFFAQRISFGENGYLSVAGIIFSAFVITNIIYAIFTSIFIVIFGKEIELKLLGVSYQKPNTIIILIKNLFKITLITVLVLYSLNYLTDALIIFIGLVIYIATNTYIVSKSNQTESLLNIIFGLSYK